MEHGTGRDCSAASLFPWVCKQTSTVELPRDVAELSRSLLLSRRPPLALEKGPRLNTGVIASGIVTLSITWSLIFVSRHLYLMWLIWWWI